VRVIIPAAGLGSRLRPYTDSIPKCMVEIAGRTLIERMLSHLYDCKVTEVVCVVGYRRKELIRHVSGLIRRPPVRFVVNEAFASTNSMASLCCVGQDVWSAAVVVIDSDLALAPRLLKTVVTPGADTLVVDRSRTPAEIDMGVQLRDDGSIFHMSKDPKEARFDAEFFGLSRWTALGARALYREMQRQLGDGALGDWYQFAIRDLAKHRHIASLGVMSSNEWVEVDSSEDLERARSAYKRGKVAWG